MSPPHRKNQHQQEIEAKITTWLNSLGAIYVTNAESSVPGSPNIDFLVLKPYPFAIESIVQSRGRVHALFARRLLMQRISIAQQYGRLMPVVGILSARPADIEEKRSTEILDQIFDVMLNIDDLPGIKTLEEIFQLNQVMQIILEKGEPKNTRITDADEISDLWKEAVSITDLLQNSPFREDSIAESMRVHARQALERRQQIKSNMFMGNTRYGDVSDTHLLLTSSFLQTGFQEVIKEEVLRKLGGRFETPELNQEFRHFKLGRSLSRNAFIWVSPSQDKIALKRYVFGNLRHFTHKIREINADAWLIRSVLSQRIERLVILLGTVDAQAPNPYQVNLLEFSGWKVAPWDFLKEEPTFVRYFSDLEG